MLDPLTTKVRNDHQFTDSGCSCGWSAHMEPNVSWRTHVLDAGVRSGKVFVSVQVLDLLHQLLNAPESEPEPEPEPVQIPEPEGLGSIVSLNLDGYETLLVHVGDGVWANGTGMKYRWTELQNENIALVANGFRP